MGARRETGRTAKGGKRISFVRAPPVLSCEWCDALEVRSLMQAYKCPSPSLENGLSPPRPQGGATARGGSQHTRDTVRSGADQDALRRAGKGRGRPRAQS